MINTSKPIPEGLDVVPSINGIIVRRRWFTPMIIGAIIFAVVWDSFLFFWYSTALGSKGELPLIAIIFPLGHVAAGVGITYYAICGLLNKTDITILNSGVKVSIHPLPWIGNVELRSSDIVSISARLKHGQYNRGGPTYQVTYVTNQNRLKTLIRGLKDYEQADFLASEISTRLNKDYQSSRPV